MAACVKCGADLPDGSKFCNFCGKPQYAEPLPRFQPAQGFPHAQQPSQMSAPNTIDKRYAKVRALILSPFIIFVVIAVCHMNALMMDVPLSSTNVTYRLFITIAVLGGILAPLPCLVMTIMGTVLASRAMKEGLSQCRVFFVIGMIEIIATIVIMVLGAAIMIHVSYLV